MANVAEVAEALEDRRKNHIASIRFALQQKIDTFDRYSTIADPIDEAKLQAMRDMLVVFDVAVRQCDCM